MSLNSPYRLGCACAFVWLSVTALRAQDSEPVSAGENPVLPKIADEPETIDPAAFMPANLAAKVTVDFSDSSLREVQTWLRAEQGLEVLLQKKALSEIGIVPGDQVSDRLVETPIYQFFNRLRSLGIAWYYEDDVLHLTSRRVATQRLTTIPYNIGDLIDAGYELDTLGELIVSTIGPGSWTETGGSGVVSFLGDVIFVHQTHSVQSDIHGLLAALRKHGRRTFTLDPPQHSLLRKKLGENVTVAFRETPLEDAVAQLAEKARSDIRLDMPTLRNTGLRQRRPITLALTNHKLRTVLQAMLIDLDLTWILRDGVLWLTTNEEAQAFLKTAVYDVRDLCRNEAESEALVEAITSQAQATSWDEARGHGSANVPRPGTLVISNTENVLGEVLDLLETYRTALRSSKPRQRPEDDPNRIITTYYRMHTDVARDLRKLLPRLVLPESWKSKGDPGAAPEITLVRSAPELSSMGAVVATTSGTERSAAEPAAPSAGADPFGAMPAEPAAPAAGADPFGAPAAAPAAGVDPFGAPTVAPAAAEPAHSLAMARSVLIIRQTRAVHDEIRKAIRRVELGDPKRSAQRPFVTSVIPVVGTSGGGTINSPVSFSGGR